MNKVKISGKDYFSDGKNYYREYQLKTSDYGKGLMQIAREQIGNDKQYTQILKLKNGKADPIKGPHYKIDVNDILLLPIPMPQTTPTQVTSFKAKHVAVAANDRDIWVLDDNGRLWRPVIDMATGGITDDWFDEPVGDAVALAVDENLGLWKLDSKGKIAYREPKQGLGDIERKWYDESLKDSAGKFVTAVQISAGGNRIAAVDDKKRLWTRFTALRGTTGTGWMLDKYSANVK